MNQVEDAASRDGRHTKLFRKVLGQLSYLRKEPSRLPSGNTLIGSLGALGALSAPTCTVTTPYKPENAPHHTHPTLISTQQALIRT